MTIRYGYKALLAKAEAQLLGLQINFLESQKSARVEKAISMKETQIKWLKSRIEQGKDPGVRVL